MQYWKYAVGRNVQEWLYPTAYHMMILHYQFTYGINVLWHNGCFWRTFTELVFEWTSSTIEFNKTVFHKSILPNSFFQVTVKNTNDGRTSKHSEYDYAKKCQTFLWKWQLSTGSLLFENFLDLAPSDLFTFWASWLAGFLWNASWRNSSCLLGVFSSPD